MIEYINGDIVMDFGNLSKLRDYEILHSQRLRHLVITIEVLNSDMEVIDTIHGLSTGGSINISNSSLIRRTGSLSFVLDEKLLPKQGNVLWLTNQIRVYAGLRNIATDDYTHFCLGTFYLTEPSVSIDGANRSITIELSDNMLRWELEELDSTFVIEADTPLNSAVENLMRRFGEWNMRVEVSNYLIPYKLEFTEGTTLLEALTTLRDLYMDMECYYDIEGNFIFKKSLIQLEDGEHVMWRFSGNQNTIINTSETFSYKMLKNRVVVIGATNENTGVTPRATAYIQNEDSPFSERNIGTRKRVIVESTYANAEQCESRARYELFKTSSLQETITITSIPIYYLDGNDVIEVLGSNDDDYSKYIIDTISIGLGTQDTMSITAHKQYYDDSYIGSDISEITRVARIIENGIRNYGWLHLAEERIENFYGIHGRGSELVIRYEKGVVHETTAYVTGYLGQTRQTLTIDVTDFDSTGVSGDNGYGKLEYSDRILGHEIFHAIFNDYFTIEKSAEFQDWFKEGLAEFIHGADERLKISIVDGLLISDTKLYAIINMATSMLRTGSWTGTSDSYSASYLLVKYIDKRIRENGKTYADLFNYIYLLTSSGTNSNDAVRQAIVSNTTFETFSEFVTDFFENAYDYVMEEVTLNLNGDELDTGSIAGSDHRGDNDLNAEDIFDNSLAVRGLTMNHLNVKFSEL